MELTPIEPRLGLISMATQRQTPWSGSINNDSETRLARRSFLEAEGQGWCADAGGLDDPRPLEPPMRIMGNDQGWGFDHRAEMLNARPAMLDFAIGVVLELVSGQGILWQIGLRALLHHSEPRFDPPFIMFFAEALASLRMLLHPSWVPVQRAG